MIAVAAGDKGRIPFVVLEELLFRHDRMFALAYVEGRLRPVVVFDDREGTEVRGLVVGKMYGKIAAGAEGAA